MQVDNMELDTTGPVGSVYNPPDGGCRAWMIVLTCFIINMCNFVVVSLLDSSKDSINAFGKEKTNDILEAFEAVRKLGVVVAAILMVAFGYRVVGIIGCILYGVGLFGASWLGKDQETLAGFLIRGLAGLGSAFLLLTAIVPPLEYFDTKRLRAFGIVKAGEILGVIGILVLSLPSFHLDFKWQHTFWYQLIPVGVALTCCATLTPLELNSSESNKSCIGRVVGLVDWKLFKHLVLYLFLLLNFFDQFGKPLALDQYPVLVKNVTKAKMNTTTVRPVIREPIRNNLTNFALAMPNTGNPAHTTSIIDDLAATIPNLGDLAG